MDRQWPSGTFLTNHVQILVSLAGEPHRRLRHIAEYAWINDRATHP